MTFEISEFLVISGVTMTFGSDVIDEIYFSTLLDIQFRDDADNDRCH